MFPLIQSVKSKLKHDKNQRIKFVAKVFVIKVIAMESCRSCRNTLFLGSLETARYGSHSTVLHQLRNTTLCHFGKNLGQHGLDDGVNKVLVTVLVGQ